MILRPETLADQPHVHALIRAAFESSPHAEGDEPEFVQALREGASYRPELTMVLELRRAIVGHLMFTGLCIAAGTGPVALLHLAMLAIHPEWQGRGLGSAILRHSLLLAAQRGHRAVSVVGDPHFYSRFGFTSSANFSIRNTNGFEDQFVMLHELSHGSLQGLRGTITLPA